MVEKKAFLKQHQLEVDESSVKDVSRNDFPSNFVFGVATSAYQVEGASQNGGRGPSIWDAFSHTPGVQFPPTLVGLSLVSESTGLHSQIDCHAVIDFLLVNDLDMVGNIIDGSNGDKAVDQYHRYKEDVELIANLGFEAYRFSISWSRIYPDGLGTEINKEGIAYYSNLINALLDKGIQPYVTLYHWDLPLHLQNTMGGWLNKKIVHYFAIYAETCFASFGDRVKNWFTINEPLQTSVNGYGCGIFAPGKNDNSRIDQYLAAHHQILAHAAAVSIYREKYKEKQGGQIGLVVDCEWAEANSDQVEDKKAAIRRLDFHLGWYLNPIYFGDYPEVMREKLGDRLPKFSVEEKELIMNSVDCIGLNHYTTRFIANVVESAEENDYYKDQEMERIVEWEDGELIGEKAASEWLYVVPWGIRKVINYITQRYNRPTIFVTENGMDEENDDILPLNERLDDKMRVGYFKNYLAAVAQSIRDGADVRGYFAWSLLDNFEWAQGYTKRFGLIYVDFNNGLSRHPKSSAYWFLRFLKGNEEKADGKSE